MKLLKNNFRLWWQKPKNVTERDLDREVTQLELFYDLVYVAIIIQLTHLVAGHISWLSIGQYIAIFMMMLWAWFNGSLYHELHGNNDMKSRLFTFLQMICLAGMGIFIHNAFGDGYQGFAFSYATFLLLLTFLWWRTGVHDPDHKPLSRPYVIAFIITTLAFYSSIFLPQEQAHILWFTGIAFSFVFSSLGLIFPSKKAKPEQLEAVRKIGHSFVERLGLLTIIILGEGILSTVNGATHFEHWYLVNILQVIGSFGILIGIWWIFFDFISRRLPNENDRCRTLWLLLHFPLWISIGLVNTGILNLLEYAHHFETPDKLILTIPLMIFFVCCIIFGKVIQLPERVKVGYTNASYTMILSIIGLIIISLIHTGKTMTLFLITLTFVLPIATAILTWLKKYAGEVKK